MKVRIEPSRPPQRKSRTEEETKAICAELKVVDVGVATAIPSSTSLSKGAINVPHTARGTRNFCEEPAMTEEEMNAAFTTGIELARDAANEECDLLGFGEMGIGNTTSAAVMICARRARSMNVRVSESRGSPSERMTLF